MAYAPGRIHCSVGGGILRFKEKFDKWWADDWHTIPRWSRDLVGWLAGYSTTRVDLTTMTYDPSTGYEHMDTVRIARKDLPPDAVHISNKGYKAYFLDRDGAGVPPAPGTATAHDMYLLLKSDALDVALEKRKSSILDLIDGKTLLLIGAAICGLAVFYWWFM